MEMLPREQLRQPIKENDIKDVNGIYDTLKDMFQDVLQEMLEAEMDVTLGYSKNEAKGKDTTNIRNGYSSKSMKTKYGNIEMDIPRDRKGEFEPKIVPKYQRNISGIEDKIIALYARGMSTRDIHDQVKDIYGIEVSAEMAVYKASSEEAAIEALYEVKDKWGKQYPYALKSWETNWDVLSIFFKYPDDIRKIIYTTNIIEGLHRQFRKVTKSKSVFPSDAALEKMLYLATKDIMTKWTQRYRNWDMVLNQLLIMFPDQLEQYI